jgi:omega-amidase
MLKSLKIALCQIKVGSDKILNIANASKALDSSVPAKLVVLPECWNSPYSTASFPQYAEIVPNVGCFADPIDSPSISMICKKAKDLNIWIVGGSIPERDGDKLYNTSITVNADGNIVGKHRKMHLFDIDVPGKITFKESDSLSPGEEPTAIDTPWGVIGVGICYDIRFPEYAMWLRKLGARILIYPGAFNMITGPAHWELLQRARAVDNNVFVATCSPARDEESGGYVAWGHSSVVTPWGEVVAKAGPYEEVVFADLDLNAVDTMRDNIPCWKQKRDDLYSLHVKSTV